MGKWPALILRFAAHDLPFILLLLFACSLGGCGKGKEVAAPLPDTTPPVVTSTSPDSGAVGVALNISLTATFSEAMAAATIDSSSFSVRDANSVPVRGAVAYSATTATFTPHMSLSPTTTHTATLSTGVTDLAGNPMERPYSWSFVTGAAPDTIAPSVISTSPSDTATRVSLDAVVSATFSEAMERSSITTATFLLETGGGAPILGIVSYEDVTRTATFTPSSPLGQATTYRATITRHVKDLAGISMSRDYVWSFVTRAAQASFSRGGSFPVGGNPSAIVASDLNGDGALDLAVPNYGVPSGTVSVLLGDGSGSFGPRTDFTVGEGARAIAAADLSGDRNVDLAVANETFRFPLPPGTAGVLLGDGTGSFGAETEFQVGLRPLDVVAADLNGDGMADVVTANQFSLDVSVLIATGAGAFSSERRFPAGVGASAIAVGDYDRDGNRDLAVVGGSEVSILRGTGAGTFGAPTGFSSGIYSESVATADLNGDGTLDLAIANDGTNHVTVLMGDGAGSFGPEQAVTVGEFPQDVTLADLNGDGIQDLVVATTFNGGRGTNTVHVVVGQGGGLFGESFGIYTVAGSGVSPPRIAVGDFNGDRKPDIAALDWSLQRVVILLNTSP